MALPPRVGSSSDTGFSELNEELATARDALLLFADAGGVLNALAGDPADPDCRYSDLTSVRRYAAVDELLQLVAGIPEAEEDDRGEEANSLYPTLLELAEVFDILIDQHSLVYGDAVALAESMAGGWHAMAGCFNHEPSPDEATLAVKQVSANLGAVPGVLEFANRLPPDARRQVVLAYERAAGLPWNAEARYLALHSIDTWLPHGISDPRVLRAVQPARFTPDQAKRTDPAILFGRATADLLLARLVRGVARDLVPDALAEPFAHHLQTG